MSLNFDNVESAGVNNNTEVRESQFKSVKPGVQDLMISAIEPTVASTGTPGVVITFDSKEAEASFIERFWLSAGALPRVQYLVEKFTGVKLTGSIPGETAEATAANAAGILAPKLVGKSKQCVVDGEKRTREKDGKTYENIYPVLRFAGFVEPEGTDAEPRITDKTAAIPAKTATAIVEANDDNSDLPF